MHSIENMAEEDPPYYGVFTYYKENTSISVENTITNVVSKEYHANSLCYKWTAGLAEDAPEQSCHPMQPCSDYGHLLPIFI